MSEHTLANTSLQALSEEKIVEPVDKKPPQVSCKFVFCDIKRGRRKLEKLLSQGHKVHVNISAVIVGIAGDDSVSTEFEAETSTFEIVFVE
jgi:hypothetical protein